MCNNGYNNKISPNNLRIPSNFLLKLFTFVIFIAFAWMVQQNRELESFFRVPLVVLFLIAAILMLVSLDENRYRYVLTEEGVEIYRFGKRIESPPWETIHWGISRNFALQAHAHELFDHSCFLTLRFDGMESPRYWLKREDYALGSIDFYTVQAFLVCCPNPPDIGENVSDEYLKVDTVRLSKKVRWGVPSRRFAAEIFQKRITQRGEKHE